MPGLYDILMAVGALVTAVLLVVVVRARHRGKAEHDLRFSIENVCPHLKPALDLLLSRGHRVIRVGQLGPDMPLEIHLAPPFDPKAIYEELKLGEPVFLSERNVLYCKEDWCEVHPLK
jgi:hypothetical protein